MKRDGQGYPVISAANSKEALEIYAREQLNIRLVVFDLVPQMEGKQCLEELLKINPHVKVIFSAGHSLDARDRLHVGALARGFVSKPYEASQMVQTFKRVSDVGGAKGFVGKPYNLGELLKTVRNVLDSD